MKYSQIIERLGRVRALTVGDAMIDHYIHGRVERLCPEGPVPIFIPEGKMDNRNGGAGHVADQLEALCETSWTFHGKPISEKTRFMVGSHLLLRVDEDKVPAATDAQRIAGLERSLIDAKYDVIVLSDYAKGWLSHTFCRWIIKYAKEHEIPVIVDPKGRDWDKYEGCTLICPNVHELKAWGGENVAQFPFMLLKCGAHGLTLYQPSGAYEFPAKAKLVFDVTGAGDIVTAVAAATIGAGGTLMQAATLANLAAGWSVGEIGTVVCKKDTLLQLIDETGVTE